MLIYDNSADNPNNPNDPPIRINWGNNSTDEMAMMTFTLLPTLRRDAPALQEALRYHAILHMEKSRLVKTEQLLACDANGDGAIDLATEVPEEMFWAAAGTSTATAS